jgi:hypothetical protein
MKKIKCCGYDYWSVIFVFLPSLYPYVCPLFLLSDLSICLSISLSICALTCLVSCLCNCVFVCIVCLPTHPSVNLHMHAYLYFFFTTFCMFIRLYCMYRLTVHLSIHLFPICVCSSVRLFILPLVCPQMAHSSISIELL